VFGGDHIKRSQAITNKDQEKGSALKPKKMRRKSMFEILLITPLFPSVLSNI
jgi:hypothetical protein